MRIISASKKPAKNAVEIAPNTWRVDDDSVAVTDPSLIGVSARDAVPARTDLPVGHWLRGYRAVRTTLAGEADQIMGEDGTLYVVGSAEELARLEKDGLVRAVAATPGDGRSTDE